MEDRTNSSSLKRDYAYGIVPFCFSKIEAECMPRYLLVKHLAGHWGFPKGHAKGKETHIQCALREFEEETGISKTDVQLYERHVFTTRYDLVKKKNGRHVRLDKSVTVYLGKVKEADATAQESEISELGWFFYDDAITNLTYDNDKNTLINVHAIVVSELASQL